MKDKNTTIKIVVFFTIAWLLFCLLFTLSVKDSGNTDFATIGNYIAGIFAPISTILFFVSILIQKSGLDDQNKRSLEQSRATERQLRIAEQRYQDEQKEIEDNKPKFVVNPDLNDILYSVDALRVLKYLFRTNVVKLMSLMLRFLSLPYYLLVILLWHI